MLGNKARFSTLLR